MTNETMHLSEVFDRSCERHRGGTALRVSDGKSLKDVSYGRLHADVCLWASFLQGRGVKAGDRVAAISAKSDNHFRFFYACWRIGAIAVPVCESLGNEEMSFVLKDCEPTLVLASETYLKKAQENAGGIPVVEWGTLPLAAEDDASKPFEAAPGLPFATREEAMESIAVLIYTSGSTGLPKGVMLSHGNIWWNMMNALECFSVCPSDELVSLLPYWHSYALTCEVGACLYAGAAIIIPHNIADFSRNLGKLIKPTVMLVVPRILDMMMASIRKQIDALPEKRRKIVDNAIYNASRIFTAGKKWNGGMFRMLYHYCFYDPLVFRKFRNALGGRLRFFVAGGAPTVSERTRKVGCTISVDSAVCNFSTVNALFFSKFSAFSFTTASCTANVSNDLPCSKHSTALCKISTLSANSAKKAGSAVPALRFSSTRDSSKCVNSPKRITPTIRALPLKVCKCRANVAGCASLLGLLCHCRTSSSILPSKSLASSKKMGNNSSSISS